MRLSADRIYKMLAFNAIGVAVIILLLWLLLAFNTRPYPNGGTDFTQAFLVWFTTGGVALTLIGVQLYIARGLWRDSKHEFEEPHADR